MTPERWAQVQDIFNRVVERPSTERDETLTVVCGSDDELRREVEELLAIDSGEAQSSEEQLRNAIGGAVAGVVSDQRNKLLGTVIGPYRITDVLGYGGMGAVYLGERADQFKQKVAIKLVEQMAVHPQLRTRLRSERQILANLQHPYIAKLIDGGETKDGIPYLVIEYIEGKAIDEYCDEKQLTVHQRLELFEKVASAVDYAHRNLIVHRDLKPANILVTADGVPKLLDFGIAKLLNSETVGHTVAVTRVQDRLLTPEHASPEQVLGRPITTATDIYSLGVLLYHLLCSRSPYVNRNSTPLALERAICNEDPPYPSSSFRESADVKAEVDKFDAKAVAARRGVTPQRLRRQLTGDIDQIILKAMRKEPEHRYASVEQLSHDLRRHRAGEPVLALQGGRRYRAIKFVRRNALGVGFATTVALALIGIALGSWFYAEQMAEKTRRISAEKDRAEQISTFLVDIFSAADPYSTQGEEVTAKELLDRGAAKIQNDLAQQPDVRAQMLESIGYVYQRQGLPERAIPLLEQSLQIRRGMKKAPDALLATSMTNLATALRRAGQTASAEAYYRQALELNRKLFGEEHERVAQVMIELGQLLLEGHSDLAEAERLLQTGLKIYKGRLGNDHLEVASTLLELGSVMLWKDNLARAEQYQREALQIYQAQLRPTHPNYAVTLAALGSTLVKRGKFDEAEKLLTESLSLQRQVFGSGNLQITRTLDPLATVREGRGDYAGAIRIIEEALEITRQARGKQHHETGYYLDSLAKLHLKSRHLVEAKKAVDEALAVFKATLPEDHLYIASSEHTLGETLLASGKPADAESHLRTAVALWTKGTGAASWRTARSENVLGIALGRLGRNQEAEQLLSASYQTLRTALGDKHELTRLAHERLANFQHARAHKSTAAKDQAEQMSTLLTDILSTADPFKVQGDPIAARQLLDRGVERIQNDPSLQPEVRAKVLGNIGYAYQRQNAPERAVPLLKQALQIRRQLNKDPDASLAADMTHLATALRLAGKTAEAEDYYAQALVINRKLFGDNHERVAQVVIELGRLHLDGHGDMTAAEQLFKKGLEIYRARLGPRHAEVASALSDLAGVMIWKDDFPVAERYLREAIGIFHERLPRTHPDYATALGSLGLTLMKLGQLDESQKLLTESIDLQRKVFGPRNPRVASALDALALLHEQRGSYREAILLAKEAADIYREVHGTRHYMTGYCLDSVAKLYLKSQRLAEAEAAIREALEIFRQTLPDDHLFIASSQQTLGEILLAKGDPAAAEAPLRAAIVICTKVTGADSWRTARSENTLGMVLAKTGHSPEAEKLLSESYRTLRTTLGDKHELTQTAHTRLATFRREQDIKS